MLRGLKHVLPQLCATQTGRDYLCLQASVLVRLLWLQVTQQPSKPTRTAATNNNPDVARLAASAKRYALVAVQRLSTNGDAVKTLAAMNVMVEGAALLQAVVVGASSTPPSLPPPSLSPRVDAGEAKGAPDSKPSASPQLSANDSIIVRCAHGVCAQRRTCVAWSFWAHC